MTTPENSTILTGSTPVYDLAREKIYQKTADAPLEIPAGAVVVPGSRGVRGSTVDGVGKRQLHDAVFPCELNALSIAQGAGCLPRVHTSWHRGFCAAIRLFRAAPLCRGTPRSAA